MHVIRGFKLIAVKHHTENARRKVSMGSSVIMQKLSCCLLGKVGERVIMSKNIMTLVPLT